MIVKLTNGENLDSKYNPSILNIDIVEPGIVIEEKGDVNGPIKTFYPWHKIDFVMGQNGEFEHELEQFYHLGISDG